VWIDVGSVDEIEEARAKVVCLPGRERVAVFRYGGQVSAVTNVCAHQRGPLGEGKVIDGCITCPWHGWEYRPQDGQSPPPFTERIATYRVRVEGRRIFLNPEPLPPGTPVEPARIEEPHHVRADFHPVQG
jgi:nitrite reductase/ring-hydroxylating ferredoxin subunit